MESKSEFQNPSLDKIHLAFVIQQFVMDQLNVAIMQGNGAAIEHCMQQLYALSSSFIDRDEQFVKDMSGLNRMTLIQLLDYNNQPAIIAQMARPKTTEYLRLYIMQYRFAQEKLIMSALHRQGLIGRRTFLDNIIDIKREVELDYASSQ